MSWGKIMSGEQLTPSDLNNPTSEIKLERRKRRVNIERQNLINHEASL